MKAIIKKQKEDKVILKIVPDTKTEVNLLKALLQEEQFTININDSNEFVLNFVKCDTCIFNKFDEEVDGTRGGVACKIRLGICECPDREYYKKIGSHTLENEFRNCIHYKKKRDDNDY